MTKNYQKLAFTPAVRQSQKEYGSAKAYASSVVGEAEPDQLGEPEKAFIESRDSFYMATVSSTDWPYVQHRGGPIGFIKVTSPTTLVMPDFRGNRQYVSVGNLKENSRAALFFMDYPRQARLKLYTQIRVFDNTEELANRLNPAAGYKARIERGYEFTLEAFDWNCPQHITPRYTETDIQSITETLVQRIHQLEAELCSLKKMTEI